jgi:DNA-binding response OmpR family regulator
VPVAYRAFRPFTQGEAIASAPCSVLIADPDPDCAASLASVLAYGGHKVRIARTGGEALRLAADDPPEVVISEARLGDLDGFALAERVMRLAPVPLVFVLLTTRDDLADRATLAGFDHFFVKPADPAELVRLVERLGCNSPEPLIR